MACLFCVWILACFSFIHCCLFFRLSQSLRGIDVVIYRLFQARVLLKALLSEIIQLFALSSSFDHSKLNAVESLLLFLKIEYK